MYVKTLLKYPYTRNRSKYWFIITIFLFVLIFQYISFNEISKSQNGNFRDIFRLLYDTNATLIDVNNFDYIRNSNNFAEIFKVQSNIPLVSITFGIQPHMVYSLERRYLSIEYNLKCDISHGYGYMMSKTFITNVYVKCSFFLLQFSLLHKRGDFLWIGDDSKDFGVDKVFGDIPRALNNFESIEYSVNINKFHGIIRAPKDMDDFMHDYKRSKFLECNRTSASLKRLKMGDSYKQHMQRNKMILPCLSHITETLDKLKKTYWLASGSLLGWYRDCDIISHTQDMDIFLLAKEYDDNIRKSFLGNKIVNVWGQHGLKNDSYELRSSGCRFTFDMMLVYRYNKTAQTNGFHADKVKFQQILPAINEFCSGELLNKKFTVPCNVIQQLDALYGRNYRWLKEKPKYYDQTSINWGAKPTWPPSLIPYIIRRYDSDGRVSINDTLKLTNRFFNNNQTIVELPMDS